MSLKIKPHVEKTSGQVSLSKDFAQLVRTHADGQGRSMAAQLEHWGMIGRAIENVIPAPALAALKSGQDAGDVLARIGAYLINQNPASLATKLQAIALPRYGTDDARPGVVIRTDPDGTQTVGTFDADGEFIPQPLSRSKSHEQQKTAPKIRLRHSSVRQAASPEKDRRVTEPA